MPASAGHGGYGRLVMRLLVVQVYAGSIPVSHPMTVFDNWLV